MKKFFKLPAVIFLILPLFMVALVGTNQAQAAPVCICNGREAALSQTDCLGVTGQAAGCSWQEATAGGSTPDTNLVNPLKGINSVPELVRQIINAALSIVGSLALIMFIYGGFVWMLAAGNEQAVEKGKNILLWATIGLVVIFASYSLVNFLITSIGAK